MKHLLLAALIGCTLASCEKVALPGGAESDNPALESRTKAFTFHVKGDFKINYVDMTGGVPVVGEARTRAAVRLEEQNTAGVTDLWVLDYVNTGTTEVPQWKLKQQVHQSSTDNGFGSVSMSLTYGHHDIKFVASKGDSPVLTATTNSVSTTAAPHSLSWSKVKDTFMLDYPVDVTASSNGNRAPELKRCVSGLTVENADAIPANAKEIQVTLANRYGTLTLPALTGSGASSYTNTFALGANEVGLKGIQFNTYTLCPTDEFVTDVTIKVVGKDNSTISEFTMNDVELKMNRKTVLKGECFGRSDGFSVVVVNDWLTDEEVNF